MIQIFIIAVPLLWVEGGLPQEHDIKKIILNQLMKGFLQN